MTDNPFFDAWTTPFGLPPFDRIRPEHFPPAFDRAMAEQLAEVDAIAAQAAPPDFDNTIAAMERSGRLIERVAAVFFNLNSSRTSDALDAVARDYAPKLAQQHLRISLHPGLFARIDDLFRRRDTLGLAEDQRRLLERRHLEFVRAGALLSADDKARMAEIAERLATLHTLFGQNVLHDEEDWTLVLGAGDLDGLPEFARAAATAAASERGLDSKAVITLARSSVEPFLTFSARRDLRQAAWEAWTRRGANAGERDNRPLIAEIHALRQEQARLLGYASYADYRLADTMAKDTAAVDGLLRRVWEPARAKAAAERADLSEMAAADGLNAPIQPWDWRYYAEKVRKARFDLDEAEIKPYFVLERMIEAAFDVAGRLFGLGFAERTDMPAYHPDVRVFEVTAGGETVGLFLRDDFARPGKHSGAWMSSYRDHESFDGKVLPIIVNNNNFAKASPTLLSFDDAKTLFHEFGHALHGLLTTARYPSQSGTAVRRDFVEFPSQVYEHWLSTPEVLRRFARHHQTGEALPEALLQRLLAARTFSSGFATVEFTASALFDMALHDAPVVTDVEAFERKVLDDIGMPAEIVLRHRPAHFQHLFAGNGYAAGYYAYLWAEVLDADGFAAFDEVGDPFDVNLAARLKTIYAAGDSRDPMALYVAFRGRPPGTDALLKKRGLVQA